MTRLLKRKASSDGYSQDYSFPEDEHDGSIGSDRPAKPRKLGVLDYVNATGPAFPSSAFQRYDKDHKPTAETGVAFEEEALQALSRAYKEAYPDKEDKPEYVFYSLDQFSAYRTSNDYAHANELVTLDKVNNRRRCNNLLFDGRLSFNGEEHYVRGVPFETLTVEGYGDDNVANVEDRLCIQSLLAEEHNVWYKLGSPAQEYVRFWEPFVWLANFTKHFVDYLYDHEELMLDHFRLRFSIWLQHKYSTNRDWIAWWNSCGNLTDFRTTINANAGYLWKESNGDLDARECLLAHPLWRELARTDVTNLEPLIPKGPRTRRIR